jgi:hypothetical protein
MAAGVRSRGQLAVMLGVLKGNNPKDQAWLASTQAAGGEARK